VWLPDGKTFADIIIRFDTIHECDGWTDRRTDTALRHGLFSFSMDTRSMSSSPAVNSLAKNRLFKTSPDIDEPPFQFIHTMDLSVVDTMLHDSPDLVIHKTEIWAVWRPQVGRKKIWRFLMQQFQLLHSRGAVCWCTVLSDTLRIAGSCMTSLRRRESTLKKSVRDITRISCFVTTMKLQHALQIYSTVFVKKCMRLQFSR